MKGLAIASLLLTAVACDKREDNRSIPIRMPLAVASAATTAAVAPAASEAPLEWTQAASARAAWAGAPARLAVSCEGWEKHAAKLEIVRYAAADPGAEAVLAIQGSKGILRLPVSAIKDAKGYMWRGSLDAGDPRAEVLLGTNLKATVPGGGMIELAPMGAAGSLISECAASAAPQTLPNLASNPATSPALR